MLVRPLVLSESDANEPYNGFILELSSLRVMSSRDRLSEYTLLLSNLCAEALKAKKIIAFQA